MNNGSAPNRQSQHSWLLIAAGVFGIVAMVAIGTAFARAINPASLSVVITGVDPGTGAVLWTEDLQLRSPLPAYSAAGTIVVEGGGIALIDAEGRTRWRLRDGHIAQVRAEGSVAYARREFSTTEDIAAIDVYSGRVLWTRSDARFSAATNDVALLHMDGGGTQVVDSRTGEEIISTREGVVDIAADGGVVALLSRQSLTIIRPGFSVVEVDMTHADTARRILAVSEERVVTEHRGERVTEQGPRPRIVTAYEAADGQVRWKRTLEPYHHSEADSGDMWFFHPYGATSVITANGAIRSDADPPPDLMGLHPVADVLVGSARLFEQSAARFDYYTYGPVHSQPWSGRTTVAVEADTGRILWSRVDTSFVAATATTAVLKTQGGYIAVGSESGDTLVAVDRHHPNSIVTTASSVLIMTHGTLTSVAADGTVATPVTVEPTSRIVAASDDVVVIDDRQVADDGRRRTTLTAYELDTGERLWRRKSKRYSSAAIDGDKLVLTRPRAVTTHQIQTGKASIEPTVLTRPAPDDVRRSPVLLAVDSNIQELRWTMGSAGNTVNFAARSGVMLEGMHGQFGVVEDVVVIVDVLGSEG